ncbi:hypothetical protein, partial [Pseudomonas sp. 2822-17]|uniref:hypothetical protein n=1 Tax=Pseudomonas sp. 2822-17 TaxID=1712678 RepID=UPI001C45ED95
MKNSFNGQIESSWNLVNYVQLKLMNGQLIQIEGQPRLIKYDKYGVDQSRVWVNEGYKRTVEDTYGRGIVGYIHKEIPELGHK